MPLCHKRKLKRQKSTNKMEVKNDYGQRQNHIHRRGARNS